jgi:O-methyltransferase
MSLCSWLLSNPTLGPLRLAGWNVLTKVLAARNLAIVNAGNEPERREFYEQLKQTRTKVNMVLRDPETYSIYSAVQQTAKVPGCIAEVGVFQGGSSRLICAAKGDREFHLFDTFAGLPEASEHDPLFQKGGFAGSLDGVKKALQGYSNLHFHQGLFPASAAGLENLRFSFVHLDVDLYQSTKDGLEWFYPKLNRGGMLISHDYPEAKGVVKAFQEFFADKPECLIELNGTQVGFVKI